MVVISDVPRQPGHTIATVKNPRTVQQTSTSDAARNPDPLTDQQVAAAPVPTVDPSAGVDAAHRGDELTRIRCKESDSLEPSAVADSPASQV